MEQICGTEQDRDLLLWSSSHVILSNLTDEILAKDRQIAQETKVLDDHRNFFREIKAKLKNLHVYVLQNPWLAEEKGVGLVESVVCLMKIRETPNEENDFWEFFLKEEKNFLLESGRLKMRLDSHKIYGKMKFGIAKLFGKGFLGKGKVGDRDCQSRGVIASDVRVTAPRVEVGNLD